MEGDSERAEPFRHDTVLSDDHLIAAVEAELHADAAEAVLDDDTLREVADAVEDRIGEPVRMAHETEVDPTFDTSVYRRGDGEFPGLLLTTSVELSGFDDQEAAVEELQRRRDTLSRVCEEMELAASVVPGEELAERVERYRARDGN